MHLRRNTHNGSILTVSFLLGALLTTIMITPSEWSFHHTTLILRKIHTAFLMASLTVHFAKDQLVPLARAGKLSCPGVPHEHCHCLPGTRVCRCVATGLVMPSHSLSRSSMNYTKAYQETAVGYGKPHLPSSLETLHSADCSQMNQFSSDLQDRHGHSFCFNILPCFV